MTVLYFRFDVKLLWVFSVSNLNEIFHFLKDFVRESFKDFMIFLVNQRPHIVNVRSYSFTWNDLKKIYIYFGFTQNLSECLLLLVNINLLSV